MLCIGDWLHQPLLDSVAQPGIPKGHSISLCYGCIPVAKQA